VSPELATERGHDDHEIRILEGRPKKRGFGGPIRPGVAIPRGSQATRTVRRVPALAAAATGDAAGSVAALSARIDEELAPKEHG
jgi:hypothetical protein